MEVTHEWTEHSRYIYHLRRENSFREGDMLNRTHGMLSFRKLCTRWIVREAVDDRASERQKREEAAVEKNLRLDERAVL